MLIEIRRLDNLDHAEVDVSELMNVSWETKEEVGSGTSFRPFYFLKAQIDYRRATELGIASGTHDMGNNVANVFIYKVDNAKSHKLGYEYLCSLAGPKPTKAIGRPSGQPPCTKKILQELADKRCLRADIRSKLLELGYEDKTIRGAFKRLEKSGQIMFSTDSHNSPSCEVWTA